MTSSPLDDMAESISPVVATFDKPTYTVRRTRRKEISKTRFPAKRSSLRTWSKTRW